MALNTLPPESIPQDDSELWGGIKISLYFHLVLALFFTFQNFVFPKKSVLYIPSLRVDLVGLPDLLKKDISKIQPSHELAEALKKAEAEAKKYKQLQSKKKIQVAKPDEMLLHPKTPDNAQTRAKKNKNALDRIKSLEKLNNEGSSQTAVKGNKISRGFSLSAQAKESDTINYKDLLTDHLHYNWALPVWLSRQSLSAQVQIFIDSRGMLHQIIFKKFSGNQKFDEMVKKTLMESQPYPLPPQELSKDFLIDGILVGFPL